MKKIVFVLMVFVVVVSTTVQANPPDTLIYNATKSYCKSNFLTKGSTAFIAEADSVVVIATDSVNNSKKIVIYAGGEIRFTEWVKADYITIPGSKDDSKISIIVVGGDANSPADPSIGFGWYILMSLVVFAGIFGGIRWLR